MSESAATVLPPSPDKKRRTKLTLTSGELTHTSSVCEPPAFQMDWESERAARIAFDGETLSVTISPLKHDIGNAATAEPEADQDASRVSAFLSAVALRSDCGRVDGAIDLVIGFFDEALSEDNLRMCRLALSRVDVARLDDAVSLAFLSMTFVVKNKLRGTRGSLFAAIERHLVARHGVGGAAKLLHGLR